MNNTNIFIISILFNIFLLFSLLPVDFRFVIMISISLIILSLILTELFTSKTSENNCLQILEINHDKNMRCLKIIMVNNILLEGEALFHAIYNTLMNNKDFLNFGFQKIIILSVVLTTEQEYNLHSNILINNNSSFKEYYSNISHELNRYNDLQYGYHNEEISRYKILCWNVDNKQNMLIQRTYKVTPNIRTYSTYSSKWYKGLINPISIYNKKGILKHPKKVFFTMDLETIYLESVKSEMVIAISSCGFYQGNLDNQIFLIDHNLLLTNPELAVKQLWSKYFKYLENVIKTEITIEDKLTIFAHNLGNFDGYFLYKGLMNCYQPDNISSLIDDSNTFISISCKFPLIEWKDSLRIFPASLDKICTMFGVEGKSSPYNQLFNKIELFNNPQLLQEFINYSLQDSKSLFQALYNAQLLYFDKFKVDIESVYSTATLSLKIYRSKFQEDPIFILPSKLDMFIRKGYFGGGTDVYQAYAENVHYYDVNSLYPAAMLNPMPYDLVVNKLIDLSNRSLDSFFGFAYVEIFCPIDMLRPVLPFHKDGKTIYPVGSWTGIYFSEELKAVSKLGYKIKLINGYEFTKANLFEPYINYFYEIKKNSVGVERNMAKLQLTNLYGYFGRKQIGLTTSNVKNTELSNVLLTRIVKSLTPINNDYTTVLTYSNVNYSMLAKLNNQFKSIGSDQHYIMSNVAIAAAVTAYARIIMIPFKIDPNTLYTDTDSMFTTKPIDPNLIGIELGMMKDELKGQVIKEAYFLGPKKYGYYLIDSEGNRKEYSIFSGVSRNSLTFYEVKSIFLGKTITKIISNRFYKSFNNLSITIKDTKISIKNTSNKQLINNIYYPPKIHKGFHNVFEILFNKFKNLINKNIKNIKKY